MSYDKFVRFVCLLLRGFFGLWERYTVVQCNSSTLKYFFNLREWFPPSTQRFYIICILYCSTKLYCISAWQCMQIPRIIVGDAEFEPGTLSCTLYSIL